MPIGDSGRIVIEIDRELKKDLYKQLSNNNLTLKEWFTKNADSFVRNTVQAEFDLTTAETEE